MTPRDPWDRHTCPECGHPHLPASDMTAPDPAPPCDDCGHPGWDHFATKGCHCGCQERFYPAPDPAPLDVERLARAIRTAELRSQMEAEKLGAVPAEVGPSPTWYLAYAAAVAAEYALAAPDPKP